MKKNYKGSNEQSEYKRLIKVSNTPDERDNDKGIIGWIGFFAMLFSGIIVYAIYYLITM